LQKECEDFDKLACQSMYLLDRLMQSLKKKQMEEEALKSASKLKKK